MRTLTISPENQQRLAIAVPVVALLLSLFVVYPTWQRYSALRAQIGTHQADLNALKSTPLPETVAIKPAEDDVPSEPAAFQEQLRLLVQVSGCTLRGFNLHSPAKQDAGPVRAVRANVDLAGRYSQIRGFLYQLSKSGRLYVVTQCSVTGTKSAQNGPVSAANQEPPGTLHAAIEIERYVTPPSP